jgi:TRAP-type transport system periplasmic protein
MKTKWKILLLTGVLGMGLLASPTASAVTEIKIATVAPRGSMWMRIFNKMKAKILKETGGEVKIRYYPGQVQGDERDVVRKMRSGQLDGGAFTAIGLAQLNPQSLILQMPMMFKTYASLDKVRTALEPTFEESFRKKGFELLGWGEIGWIYLFGKNKVTSLADLKKQKIWVWDADPISKKMYREVGIKPRLLGLPQVLPALNTGIVNTISNSPLGCMALQWHSKVKFMAERPIAVGVGATVINKAIFDKLSPEHQAILKKVSAKYHRAMIKRIRKDNDKALAALKSGGIETVKMSDKDFATLKSVSSKVAKSFVPRYYSQALLQKALSLR